MFNGDINQVAGLTSLSTNMNGAGAIIKTFQTTTSGVPTQQNPYGGRGQGQFSSTLGPNINGLAGSQQVQFLDADNIMENANQNPQVFSAKTLEKRKEQGLETQKLERSGA